MEAKKKEVAWIRNPLINKAKIRKVFEKKMRERYEDKKNFGFYWKQNEKSERNFTDEELNVLAEIKGKVQNSIENGHMKYLFLSKFIEIFLIPSIVEANKNKFRFNKIKNLKRATLISAYNSDTKSDSLKIAQKNAIEKLKKYII